MHLRNTNSDVASRIQNQRQESMETIQESFQKDCEKDSTLEKQMKTINKIISFFKKTPKSKLEQLEEKWPKLKGKIE